MSHVPQSILKQSTVSRHCDGTADSSVHTTVPLLAQDAQSSISTGSTSISAATLQSTMPVGADLNEYITSMLKGKPVAGVHQNVTPVRKSSLVCPRSGPSPSADVTRSTSLRQPTRSDANEWLPVRHAVANAQLNYPVPLPVEAHIHRIPFASPMTVTSSPVHNASGAAVPSSDRPTPPAYYPPPMYNRAKNVEQPTFTTPPQSQLQRSNHFVTVPVGRAQYDSLQPSPLTVQSHAISGDRRPYFDVLAPESSANSSIPPDSTANSVYRLVPFALADPVDSTQPCRASAEECQSVTIAVGKPIAPPSYPVAKSRMMSALSLTPPGTKRYFEDIAISQQGRFAAQSTGQSNSITGSTTATSVDLTNGDSNMHRSYVATPSRVANGRHEPVANGPMSVPHTMSMGVAVTQSAANRQVSCYLITCSG